MAKLQTTKITEGDSCFSVPKQSFSDPHHCPVFYNPEMQFNRDLSTIFLKTCIEHCKITKPRLFDGYTGVGIRGIRYLKESDIESAVLCDAGDASIPFIEKNILLNKVSKRASVMHMDVNQALSTSPLFDVIEMDPFGSPIQNIDSAFRRGKKKFILSLTFTDLANLCGGHKDACKRFYNAQSINCAFCHELAMRIIIGRVANIASLHEFGITPLVSWYQGHYVKTLLLCESGALKADANFNKLGYAWLCKKCGNRGTSIEVPNKCDCGEKLNIAGPLWLDKFSSKEVLKKAAVNLTKQKFYTAAQQAKLAKFIGLLVEESEVPLFYSLSDLCSQAKLHVPKLVDFMNKLRSKGFEVTPTHFAPGCFKTNATIKNILALLK